MASISTDKRGNRRILFVNGDGQRKQIRLGKTPIKTARTIKSHVEDLVAASLGRHAPAPETSAWVGDLKSKLHGKLAAVGLVTPRESTAEKESATLGGFLEQYIDSRSDIKPGTKTNGAGKSPAILWHNQAAWRYFAGQCRRVPARPFNESWREHSAATLRTS
ncbi:MAG: hypothetical protein ABFC77_12805 [Thermoguttaceae bacterium]